MPRASAVGWMLVARDITERKNSEKTLRRLNRALVTLTACNEALVSEANEKDLLGHICNILIDKGGYKGARVQFLQANEGSATGKPLPFNLYHPDLAASGVPHSSRIALPLATSDGMFALLKIEANDSATFDEEEVKLLRELADDLAYGISALRVRHKHREAQEELRSSMSKLRKTLHGFIEAVSLMVETRDPYTAGHQRRVANLARAIAREMQLEEDDIESVYMASVVHDLGKIAVPSEILSKPGRIGEAELSLIRTHSQAGYDILKTIDFPWPIADIVLQHHERLDGSGYPCGLKGDAISHGARILAVADVLEAMASHRPYRPSLGVDKGIEEISSKSGTHFDQRVVSACLALHEKGVIKSDQIL